MSSITPLSTSTVTRVVNNSFSSGASFQNMLMAIALAQTELNQVKGTNIAKSAQSNVNKLDAANQLQAQLKTLEALRTEKKIDKDKTMEGQAADCKQFVDNLKNAGISMSADEYTKWSAGKMTDADMKTIESRIKAMSDNASNNSSIINLELQKTNNAMQQSTNMFMSFMDSLKQMLDKIFR
jgi:hypothetical protein